MTRPSAFWREVRFSIARRPPSPFHREPWHQRIHPCVWRELKLSIVLMSFSTAVFWVFAHLVSGTMGWFEWMMLYALIVVLACALLKRASDRR